MIQEKDAESLRTIEGHSSYSQAHQDLFVRAMLGFKTGGSYVEIGASEPKQSNNTFILERDFRWSGISFDIDPFVVEAFRAVRVNPCLVADGTTFDYLNYFMENKFPKQIDYLSLDIDPAEITYKGLQRLPLSDYRFSVITYEHDKYISGTECMKKSRDYLESFGYLRVVSNVLCCDKDFEDWYVDPKVVSAQIYEPYVSERIECADIFKNKGNLK
jgi:hypothetical protein